MYLKVGLEVHAQLASIRKLFSATRTSFAATPNSRISFYDAALPGTQPIFNWECMFLGIKAATALNCNVSPTCSFDRKHYMYPDQPAGYQITQFFQPFAQGGYLDLYERDFRSNGQDQRVRLKQIQLEQDTGKSTYVDDLTLIDLNRTNTPLIELVTEPDLRSAEAAGVFVRKLQVLLRHLGVCAGTMETGALRVDVNVSAHGEGYDGPRCEIKNLFSTTAVVSAIKAEFKRQVADIKAGKTLTSETRGWDGKKTWTLRGKEGAIDYRYMPDPEIPVIRIPETVVDHISRDLPALPDVIFSSLLEAPYNLKLVDARTLMDHGTEYVEFYKQVYSKFEADGGKHKEAVINWLTHKWLGQSSILPPVGLFTELLLLIDSKEVTTASARLVLNHFAALAEASELDSVKDVRALIQEYGLEEDSEGDTLAVVCQEILRDNPDVVDRIKKGKKTSIGFLLGQVMKATQGTHDPKKVKDTLLKYL